MFLIFFIRIFQSLQNQCIEISMNWGFTEFNLHLWSIHSCINFVNAWIFQIQNQNEQYLEVWMLCNRYATYFRLDIVYIDMRLKLVLQNEITINCFILYTLCKYIKLFVYLLFSCMYLLYTCLFACSKYVYIFILYFISIHLYFLSDYMTNEKNNCIA